LKNLPGEVLSNFVEECLLRDLQKGDVLFEGGEEGNSIFITLFGELIVWGNDVEIVRHSAGHYLDEMALIEFKPRSVKVVAFETTYLLEITHELFYSQFSTYPDAFPAIMKTLANRVDKI
jgi:CRP-like cAMP-binding protein